MKLHHFSSVEILEPVSVAQISEGRPKPKGLWLSDENKDGWSAWAKAEDWSIGKYKFNVEVDMKKILWLSCAEDLFAFTKEYEMPHDFHFPYYINWKSVAQKFSGILITPYIWECRLDDKTSWYYGWDCASACIWNSDSIKEISGNKFIF